MNIKEILDRDPPPILYHYTTQQGLLGIINDKEIWATHTQYLNDVREFHQATELMRKELWSMLNESPVPENAAILRHMQRALGKAIETANVCVCSFSGKGDSLSQWKSYGGGTSGFAIGFSVHTCAAWLRSLVGLSLCCTRKKNSRSWSAICWKMYFESNATGLSRKGKDSHLAVIWFLTCSDMPLFSKIGLSRKNLSGG